MHLAVAQTLRRGIVRAYHDERQRDRHGFPPLAFPHDVPEHRRGWMRAGRRARAAGSFTQSNGERISAKPEGRVSGVTD